MLTVLAPAKLNLTLEVLKERQDGFHEIRSVLQTINLCDSLRFYLSEEIELSSDRTDWIPGMSLVSRASNLLREVTGYTGGVTIEIKKRIPWLSGLGGDSSDAAAILRGLNRLWGLRLPQKKLLALAAQLSSDVSFFLFGGTALAESRGEIITPLPSLPRTWIVLMVPPVSRKPGKTKQLYSNLNTAHYTEGGITDRFVSSLVEGEELVSANIFNVFDKVALTNFAGLDSYREQFLRTGAPDVHLAGSGPALFTLLKDRDQAEKIYRNLRGQGLECYLSDTLAPIDSVR